MSNTEERDLGTQPLDAILLGWQLDNHDVVEASPQQLTHKQLVRARNGRRLTLKMMIKVARTVNFAVWGRLTNDEREKFTEYSPKHLFSYSKGWDATYLDPNKTLYGIITGREIRADFRTEIGI
jgi:hypothetical protein